MVVEPAFADRHGASRRMLTKPLDITARIEPGSVVRMNPGRIPYISGVSGGDSLRRASGAEDIPGAAP